MEKKSSKTKSFWKRNVYYIIMAVCLLAIAAMVTLTILINNGVIGKKGDIVNDTPDAPAINTEPTQTDTQEPIDQPTENPTETPTEKPVEQETPTAIVFACPVEKVNIGTNYSMDALVWNASLKHYAVHDGIDFLGNDGDNVFAAYDGVVESVNYDALHGHSVTIKHNDSLKTTYSSLNTPTVTVGQGVKKGGVIGTMSSSATNEYSLGAHVHFSATENGVEIDPNTYLTLSEIK